VLHVEIDLVIFRIPKGSNSVAVGERSDTHGLRITKCPDPERGQTSGSLLTPSGSTSIFFQFSVGVAALAHVY